MSTKSQPTRDTSPLRIYLAGAVACALISTGAYVFGISPALSQHSDQAARQAELLAAKRKAAGLAGARTAALNQLNSVNQALNSQTLHLEPASTVNQRLARLMALATKDCGLSIDELRPGTATESGDYQAIPILMAGSGTYPACAKFLHKLRQTYPDTAVRSFETTNNSASPDTPAATFQFELVWHAARG